MDIMKRSDEGEGDMKKDIKAEIQSRDRQYKINEYKAIGASHHGDNDGNTRARTGSGGK